MATRQVSIYEDKETGDINELRDNKLAKLGISDPNANVGATDYVELMTSTGEPIKVTQQSLAAALGSIFVASDPKTFTKLLGMNSGSPMGIGPSDLASVLGVDAVYANYSVGSFTPGKLTFGLARNETPSGWGVYIRTTINHPTENLSLVLFIGAFSNDLYYRKEMLGVTSSTAEAWKKISYTQV